MLLGVHIGSPGKFCGTLCPGDIIYRRLDNSRPSACAPGYRAACRQGAERFYHRMVTPQHLHRLGHVLVHIPPSPSPLTSLETSSYHSPHSGSPDVSHGGTLEEISSNQGPAEDRLHSSAKR